MTDRPDLPPEPSPGSQPGKMRPLAPSMLAGLAAAGFGLGWILLRLFTRTTMIPVIGWLTPVAWGILAVVLGVMARVMHVRNHVRRERIEPQRAVTSLALGRAGAVVGALFTGGYASWAVTFGNELRFGAPSHRVWVCGVSVVVAAVVATAGVLLERACRVPKDDDSDDD